MSGLPVRGRGATTLLGAAGRALRVARGRRGVDELFDT